MTSMMTKLASLSPRITVHVSKADIESAIPRDPKRCMLVEALRRKLPWGAQQIRADMATIRWTDPVRNLRYAYLTPNSAQKALIKFDHGIKPEPFTFELRGAIHLSRAVAAGKQKPKAVARSKTAKPSTLPKEARRERRTEPEILAAINNPRAHLGSPKLILDRDNRGEPVKVGGKAPITGNIGQLAPFRKFGACEFVE